jgi:hypothetical protein
LQPGPQERPPGHILGVGRILQRGLGILVVGEHRPGIQQRRIQPGRRDLPGQRSDVAHNGAGLIAVTADDHPRGQGEGHLDDPLAQLTKVVHERHAPIGILLPLRVQEPLTNDAGTRQGTGEFGHDRFRRPGSVPERT